MYISVLLSFISYDMVLYSDKLNSMVWLWSIAEVWLYLSVTLHLQRWIIQYHQ